jgi:hypothetical protein
MYLYSTKLSSQRILFYGKVEFSFKKRNVIFTNKNIT